MSGKGVDREKRRRVMGRSIALGHCICNPRQPCPCPEFKEKNLCRCAGEREERANGESVPLTRTVRYAGCASKINRRDLRQVLQGLPESDDPRVLVGAAAGDDAGVYELENGTCLVQTVDVFAPSVDDPYVFGEVCAANSLSDVYAMGGKPLTALSVVGYPVEKLPLADLNRLLQGGLDKMKEAGVPVIGGHSINDPEVKFGFAVTGLVEKEKIVRKAQPRAGDRLVLTKPLGTGIAAFAGQIGRASPETLAGAADSMRALNAGAARAMAAVGGISAATDVTGFGFLGHLANLMEGADLAARVEFSRLPFLPGVKELAAAGVLPGGLERNRESVNGLWAAGAGVSELMVELLFDPQTSGGLLIAVPAAKAKALIAALEKEKCLCAADVGEIVPAEGKVKIMLENQGGETLEPRPPAKPAPEKACCAPGVPAPAAAGGEACCAHAPVGGDTAAAWQEFMAAANAPGAIDAKHKRLTALALSVALKCAPCIELHVNKARELGSGDAEINEAVWLGVAFAGAPALMFYKELGLTAL